MLYESVRVNKLPGIPDSVAGKPRRAFPGLTPIQAALERWCNSCSFLQVATGYRAMMATPIALQQRLLLCIVLCCSCSAVVARSLTQRKALPKPVSFRPRGSKPTLHMEHAENRFKATLCRRCVGLERSTMQPRGSAWVGVRVDVPFLSTTTIQACGCVQTPSHK